MGLADQGIFDISFGGFENIDIEKILLILNETYDEKVPFYKQVKKLFNSRWYDRYEYQYNERHENKFIAFYSDFYFRNDHITIFDKFIKEFPMFDYVIPVKLPNERRNWKRGFEMIKWDIHSLWQLKGCKVNFNKKLFLIRILGLSRLYSERMNNFLKRKKYLYGLVYSDSNPYENMLVQWMKKKGIYTATLQHGIFDKRGYWKGLEFRSSVADDWLVWNLYSKELAIECGISRDKIRVLGIPRYIKPVELDKKTKTGIFSVILGGKVLFEENQKLVKVANRLAKEEGLKYFLRYHPSCKGNEYDEFIDKQFIAQRDVKKETINQMCEHSDFSLVGSGTSMIIDLIYLKQPFFQYYEKWDGNRYKVRENYFRNFDELKEEIKKETITENDEMFDYYCKTRKVKESYKNYFDSVQTFLKERE